MKPKTNPFPSLHPEPTGKDARPNKAGKLKGYCTHCGGMVMRSESECVKCGCPAVTPNKPKGKRASFRSGYSPSTAGNQRSGYIRS